MSVELNLRFPDPHHVIVRWGDLETDRLDFTAPLTEKERRDLAWYLETYAAHYTTTEDDEEAARIAAQLPELGKKLFAAAFHDTAAAAHFQDFLKTEEAGRLLTITAEHPAVLGLPWELLHTTGAGGAYLINERPRIAIRRRVAGSSGTRQPYKPIAKDSLHLLFVISRPSDAGFIDPRADAQAVLDAIDEHAAGRVTVEFLRPATFQALVDRLDNEDLPPINVLHFDGHGVFDDDGAMKEEAQQSAARLPGATSEWLRKEESPGGANTGYLLFEEPGGKKHLVPAAALGDQLHRCKIGLVVLSACQTAMLGSNDDAMGSVAARLTSTGIPAVLAMSHSVLVPTTGRLFGKFYEQLARGKGVGEALETARNHLRVDPKRREVQRGAVRQWLELEDWCVPALYQPGADVPLLKQDAAPPEVAAPLSNLPPQDEVIFVGRRRELWDIERWFVGGARRVSLSGFGGQGKTHLAQEAARWLLRTGMFGRAVFVSYASFQGVDALGYAVATIAAALEQSLPDKAAVTTLLKAAPTLLILDNLEDVPAPALAELLSATKDWSECGDSRVLVTARPADLNHAAFALQNDPKHRHLTLRGLDEESTLALYNAVLKLPPEPTAPPPSREALLDLFRRVEFHPLSLRLLSQQLKTRRVVDIATRLIEELLADTGDDKDKSLRASLKLSLDKLAPEVRDKWLPRLGVFQGGAIEDSLLAVTGLGKVDEDPDVARARRVLAALESGDIETAARLIAGAQMGVDLPDDVELTQEWLDEVKSNADEQVAHLRDQLAQHPESAFAAGADETTWPHLKSALQAAALIEVEDLSPVGVGVPFLKFHPTLAPVLWAQLSPEERDALSAAHRRRYYGVSQGLRFQDQKNPYQARAEARRELPNLLHAVRGALEVGEEWAVDFTDHVGHFLAYFGLKRDATELNERAVASAGGERQWFLAQSNRGEQLWKSGNAIEAAAVFTAILQRLGDAPAYKQCITLNWLGRCLKSQGQPDLAAQRYREALDMANEIEQSDGVKWLRGTLQTDLGDVLLQMGQYAEAREAYEASLAIMKDFGGDPRGEGATKFQLGTLARHQGDLSEAAERYVQALSLFQLLKEPESEAMCWHGLGNVFLDNQQLDRAEDCYRESAHIWEAQGNLSWAGAIWDQLAQVNVYAGKPQAAEAWYRKALEGGQQTGDRVGQSRTLNNLAGLLQDQPNRLAEARQLAEESLAIKKTLDPGATQIWKSYTILAQIAGKQNDAAQARDYRRQERTAYRNFPGSQYQLQRFAPLIDDVVATVAQPQQRAELEPTLAHMEQGGYVDLVAAIHRILDGERDGEALCEPLDYEDSLIVETILAKLGAPE